MSTAWITQCQCSFRDGSHCRRPTVKTARMREQSRTGKHNKTKTFAGHGVEMQTDCLTADDKEGLRTYTFHLPSAHSANGDCLPLLVSVLIVSRPRYIDFVASQTPRSSCGGSAFRHPPDLHNISSCSACALACADEPRCRGFEYQPVGSQCALFGTCLLYTSPSPRDATLSRMPSSA